MGNAKRGLFSLNEIGAPAGSGSEIVPSKSK